MFCPTCVRSYPEDSEKCPKCQGPLTNVIEIFSDDDDIWSPNRVEVRDEEVDVESLHGAEFGLFRSSASIGGLGEPLRDRV